MSEKIYAIEYAEYSGDAVLIYSKQSAALTERSRTIVLKGTLNDNRHENNRLYESICDLLNGE